MEFIHGRPLLRDVFSPPRQVLNDENEYLCHVGLIILIRGFPTPELPQLITARMATLHGGDLADYVVSQATITPYIITCPNSRIRDAVVRGGLYSIPQTQIQFTVHEWRPRFGMGYDPPTHQAWIRIIGLPLQAWTVSEITSFIQNFGYPLQILPFGRDAGHYRDITALIATKHPATVPLAYRYREGDYSAQVDILLLTWRAWEDTTFPPPPDPNRHADPPIQPHQPNQQNDPTISAHHSSSSSSNNAPSEPTIDYSSWSPRSYRLGLLCAQKGAKTLANAHPQTNPKYSQITVPLLTTGKYSQRPMATRFPPPRHNHATDDPLFSHDFRGVYLLLQTHALSIPNPIHINPLSFLQTHHCDGHVLGAARGKSTETLSRTMPPVRSTILAALTLEVRQYSPMRMVIQAYQKEKIKLDKGPHTSPRCSIHIQNILSHRAHSGMAHPSLPPTQGPLLPTHGPSFRSEADMDGLRLSLSPLSSDANDDDILVGPPGYEQRVHPTLPLSDGSPVLTRPPQKGNRDCTPQAITTAHTRKRDGRLPTRRSKRLQEKHQTASTDANLLTAKKTKMAKIPFDLETSLTPLDAATTIQILQATGLKIDSQIEQMIQHATEQDKITEEMQHIRPSTPLHDQTPPLQVSGTNMLL